MSQTDEYDRTAAALETELRERSPLVTWAVLQWGDLDDAFQRANFHVLAQVRINNRQLYARTIVSRLEMDVFRGDMPDRIRRTIGRQFANVIMELAEQEPAPPQ